MKRQVFSCFLKLQTEASDFILSGQQFHSVAAAYLKDMFPYVIVLACGTTSSDLDDMAYNTNTIHGSICTLNVSIQNDCSCIT